MAKGGSGIGFGRVDDVDQVVRCAGERGGIRLGGADVHVAEHQCGIDADEFHRQTLRQFHCNAGLAAGSGAHQEDDGRLHLPRMNIASSSAIEIWNQVGRPWLH